MSRSMMRGVRFSLSLAVAGAVFAGSAHAQPARPAQAGARVQPIPDAGSELRRHLTTLADDPRNLDALIGAGRAALAGGDTQAALTFFSRAGDVAPRDARVRAGMASVLVRMERGQPALNLFAEAVALGAPVAEIAGDRGLAHDMVGDPRRAQQDYAFVLQRREDPEIRRRLALSLAISGEREAALRAIDGQLRRNERAAWRTQAFILALTGDAAGANRTAQGLMPASASQAMAPFFARLGNLSPSQKAMAAHFGRFPSHGAAAVADRTDIQADPGALALAGGAPAARPRAPAAEISPAQPRRRPGGAATASRSVSGRQTASRSTSSQEGRASSRTSERPSLLQQRQAVATAAGREVAAVQVPVRRSAGSEGHESRAAANPARRTEPMQSPPAAQRAEPQAPPLPQATNLTAPIDSPPGFAMETAATSTVSIPPASEAQPPAPPSAPASSDDQAVRAIDLPASGPAETSPGSSTAVSTRSEPAPSNVASAPGGFTLRAEPAAAQSGPSTGLTSAPESPPAAPSSGGLSDIAALVATLPDDEAQAAARSAAARRPPAAPVRTVAAAPETRSGRPAARPAAASARPAFPRRHWVQIAGGANTAALPRELARLRGLAPELADRNAWVTPANSTNRLLVGPCASTAEGQEFVNLLAQRNIPAFVWTSEAGQEIARLQPGR